jgi:hypothetical protein
MSKIKKGETKKMSKKAKEMTMHYKKGLDYIAKNYPEYQIDQITWSQMNYGENGGLDFEIVVSYLDRLGDTQPTYIMSFKSKKDALSVQIYKATINRNGHYIRG